MRRLLGRGLRRVAGAAGYDLTARDTYPPDFDDAAIALVERVRPFTMTSPERVLAVRDAARYVARAGVPGAVVECGVWRGGSTLAAVLTLQAGADLNRDVYLYDTFSGMTGAGSRDVDLDGRPGEDLVDGALVPTAPLDDVRRLLEATGWPADRLHFVEGPVEDTIPGVLPSAIAMLRLDTDFYESTRHELEHLFPLVSPGGVVIIDDYGHWAGAREAVDEYLAKHGIELLLHRIDYTGRMAIVGATA